MSKGGFIGRGRELGLLAKRFQRVVDSQAGVAVAVRGRRQVGKSRLVQEFCNLSKVPYAFFAATKGASPIEAVASFMAELRGSSLADPERVPALENGSWPDAFRVLAASLSSAPAIVVLDEVPWLSEQDPIFDGALQTAWDRLLSQKAVLLVLLGSDLHVMERLTAYDRPFYGRADNFVLGPLSPVETGNAVGLDSSDAIDAYLISGGLPGILKSWPHGTTATKFLKQECADPAAPVFGVPESALLAEFPIPDQARRVIEAVGSGDRTHANIASNAGSKQGPVASGTLSPLLRKLVEEKRILAMDAPLSCQPGKPALYRVADPNLRLYLGVLRQAHEMSRRGRDNDAYKIIERRWASWRGRAVEPLIRESLELAASGGGFPWPEAARVGAWWNRQFNPEVDLVGADRGPVARSVHFAGSVKWLVTPFDKSDMTKMLSDVAQVPGYAPGNTGHVVVSLSGVANAVDRSRIDLIWGPDEVMAAWSAVN